MLQRKLAGFVVAGLLLGAGAVNAAESVFPSNADEGIARLAPLSTYADQYAGAAGRRGEPVQNAESPFPTDYAASSD